MGLAMAIGLLTTSAQSEILIGIALPLTGTYAWTGETMRRGAMKAIEQLNENGGVIGEALVPVLTDDFCDPDQAMAAARKLVEENVAAVIGHPCSGAAVPASEHYEEAGIVFISTYATNPTLTERGLGTTFRVVGRDDLQGEIVADHLAEAWSEADVALVHDGQVYGEGVTDQVRRRLNEHDREPRLIETIVPGTTDFSNLVDRLEAADIEVLFFGGYTAEGGILIRQVRKRLPDLVVVIPDGVGTDDLPLIVGDAIEGVRMTSPPDVATWPEAADVMETFRSEGFEPGGSTGAFQAYATIEAWAQAVEEAGTLDGKAVAAALREGTFETVLGTIGFDDKGDVTGYDSFVWYEWTADGPVQADRHFTGE
jgi:branched-chain amino acid transport system substrate-binding protein